VFVATCTSVELDTGLVGAIIFLLMIKLEILGKREGIVFGNEPTFCRSFHEFYGKSCEGHSFSCNSKL